MLRNKFINIRAEYAGSVRNLYCEGDSPLEKTAHRGFLGTRAQITTERI